MVEIVHYYADSVPTPDKWRSLADGSFIDPGTPFSPAFPGDPGPGKLYSGCTVVPSAGMGVSDACTWLSDRTGKAHVLARIYGTSDWNWSKVDTAIALGRIPFHTTSFSGFTIAQIAAGGVAINAHLDTQAAQCIAREPIPLFLEYKHEPEDDYPSDADAATYRAACRYIVQYMRAQGVTNVAWHFPAWMVDWSFGGATGTGGAIPTRGNAWKWDPDWKGTLSGAGIPNASDWYTGAITGVGDSSSVIDILAADQYSPAVNSDKYRRFNSHWAHVTSKLTAWGRPEKPWILPEIGTSDATSAEVPGDFPVNWDNHWAEFLATAITPQASSPRIIGYAYFNYDAGGQPDFILNDPTGERLAAYTNFVQNPQVLGVGDF